MVNLPVRMPLTACGTTPALGCTDCEAYPRCGGLYVREPLWDCFTGCGTGCRDSKCDYTCPFRPDYADRWREVGGLMPRTSKPLIAPKAETLPLYIPMIRHGRRREHLLDRPVVALSTFDLVRRHRNGFGLNVHGAEELRSRFMLAPTAEVLLISVARDHFLEDYWRHRRVLHLPEQLAALDLLGMSVPNFSLFLDAPRTHTLWNRARMLRTAGELSDTGVGIVPHLQAATAADWDAWANLLTDQPQIRYVAKEFCTGLTRHKSGRRALERLALLQDRVGRSLHPVAIGGARFLPHLQMYFDRFSIVDSVPFMRTVYRRVHVEDEAGRRMWQKQETPPGAPLDELLSDNIRRHDDRLLRQLTLPIISCDARVPQSVGTKPAVAQMSEPGQLSLGF